MFSHQGFVSILLSTDNGKLIEHIYGFLMVAERILAKYDQKNSENKSE
jgi:hypothetical protein